MEKDFFILRRTLTTLPNLFNSSWGIHTNITSLEFFYHSFFRKINIHILPIVLKEKLLSLKKYTTYTTDIQYLILWNLYFHPNLVNAEIFIIQRAIRRSRDILGLSEIPA